MVLCSWVEEELRDCTTYFVISSFEDLNLRFGELRFDTVLLKAATGSKELVVARGEKQEV